jgi:hypothetical protein
MGLSPSRKPVAFVEIDGYRFASPILRAFPDHALIPQIRREVAGDQRA